jgi:hypothetical protein
MAELPQTSAAPGLAPHQGMHPVAALGTAIAAAFTLTFAQTLVPGLGGGQALAQSAPDDAAAQRFQTPDGGVRFVLDRTGQRAALVKFEGDDEIYVLRPVGGPRGDEIYKTDTGDVMLRITPLGGVIVYRENAPNGAPAMMTGRVAPIAPAPPPGGSIRVQVNQLERTAQNRFGRSVPVELPPAAAADNTGVVADAARRAAEGLDGAPPGVVVDRVVIRLGNQPAAVLMGNTLVITVAPQQGYAGRPSAAAVRRAVQVRGPAVDVAGEGGSR